ncbi:uncharacterized protein LOC111101076 isoform X2 [Crassostrea virginica]
MGKQRNKIAGVRGSNDLDKQKSYLEFLENSWKSKSESKEYTLKKSSSKPRATPKPSEDGEKTKNQQGTGSVVLLHKCQVCKKAYLRLSSLEKHEQSHEGKEIRISNKVVPQPPSNAKNKNKSQKKKHCQESKSSNFVENSQDMLEFTPNVSTIQTTSSTANFHDIQDLISAPPTHQEFVDKSQNAPLQLKENMKSLDSNALDGLLLVSGFQDKPTLVYPANLQTNSSESSSSPAKNKFTSNSVKNPLISFQPEEDEVLESLWNPSSALQSEDVVINASSTDEEVHTQVTKILDFLETEEADGTDMNNKESSLNSSHVILQVPVTLQPVDDKDEHLESVLEDEKNSKENDKDVRDSDMKYVPVQAEEEKDNAETIERGKTEDLKDISEDEDDVMDDPYEGDNGEDEDHISDVKDETYENMVENVNEECQGKEGDISIELDKVQKTSNSEKNGMDLESCEFSRDRSIKDFHEDISDEDVNDGDEVEDKHNKSFIGLFSCSVCQEEFKDDVNLQTHKRKHVEVQLQSKSKEGALICDICGNSFKSKTGLSLHKKIHSKSLQCVECGKIFSEPILLSRHMLTHNKVKHMCDICGKSYTTIGHLGVHISSAHDSTTYDCKECGKVFKHTSNLRLHMRTHFGAKSFICENCGMAFKFSSVLHRHRKIHRNEKNADCSTCGKSFRCNYTLKIHMLTHTKEKPHSCIICRKRFNHKVSLRLHIEKFH